MNAIFHLRPWKEGQCWLFDDEARGLKREPFVPDASVLIDELVKTFGVKQKEKTIGLLFAARPFPGSVELRRVQSELEGCGVTYRWEEKGLDGWLCPAFFKYFNPTDIPPRLYAIATA